LLFSLENLYRHYLQCRRNKRNTLNALRFEARQEERLLALQEALVNHTYALCSRPKSSA
jgi:RNA-directed DNA polymerase